MMKFKRTSWELSLPIDPGTLSVLVVENGQTLWRYCAELLRQSAGEPGEFQILRNVIEQPLDKICVVETNIAGITLNTKKLQNALLKKCVERATEPEFEETLRTVSNNLYELCEDICHQTGYYVDIDEDIDTQALFKLFSISFQETFPTLLDKLLEYVNINSEFLRIKVVIFLFLTQFLSDEDLQKLHAHCAYQEISLILIEASYPTLFDCSVIPSQCIIIDKDDVEIARNIKTD